MIFTVTPKAGMEGGGGGKEEKPGENEGVGEAVASAAT